jgi:hypothetical protein
MSDEIKQIAALKRVHLTAGKEFYPDQPHILIFINHNAFPVIQGFLVNLLPSLVSHWICKCVMSYGFCLLVLPLR